MHNQAVVISCEDETYFWENCLLGATSLVALQHTVFFCVSLHFVLQEVQEQHDLLVEQLERVPIVNHVYSGEVFYKYMEYISKNSQHWFKVARVATRKGECMFNLTPHVVW